MNYGMMRRISALSKKLMSAYPVSKLSHA